MNENRSVLVISDSHEQFSLTASMLRQRGYSVSFEKNINMSLEKARTSPPKLIISELAVPDIDGLQLCCRVRSDVDLAATPVLLVGDLSKQSSIVSDSLRCGAADYLQKPVDPIELFSLCRDMVDPNDPDPSDASRGKINDATTVLDPDGTILFESPSSGRVFGSEATERLGRKFTEMIHPADVPEFMEFLDAVRWLNGKTSPIECRFRQKDGGWRLIESTGTPMADPQFGSAVVITSREVIQNDASLKDFIKDDFARTALFDNASTRMALFSPSGRILASNSALRRMFDPSEADLCGIYLSEVIFPQGGEGDKLALVDLMCGRRSQFQFQNGYLASTGERVWGQLTVGAIRDAEDRTQFLLGIFDEPITADQVRRSERKIDPTCFAALLPELDRCDIDYGLISEN